MAMEPEDSKDRKRARVVLYMGHEVVGLSYPVFMPKPSTHRMQDPGSNVPHIRQKGSQKTKCHNIKYN
jgi:hypothetical protein